MNGAPTSSDPTATVTPKKFAHAVLRTRGRYDEMVAWFSRGGGHRTL